MGGLKSAMPFTHLTFLIGTLALIGIPPFAGFWSKDAIVSSAGAMGGVLELDALRRLPGRRAAHGALRDAPLLLRLPWGSPRRARRLPRPRRVHHGEGPQSMRIPVALLAEWARRSPGSSRFRASGSPSTPGSTRSPSRSCIPPSPRTT